MSFTEEEKKELFAIVRSQGDKLERMEKNIQYIGQGLYGSNKNDVPGLVERVKKIEKFNTAVKKWVWAAQGGIAAVMMGIMEFVKNIQIK